MRILSAVNEVTASKPFFPFGKRNAYFLVACSGNSASASLQVSPNGVDFWMPITSLNLGAGVTATAQIFDMLYPAIRGTVDWVSAGTNVATVTMFYQTGV